MKIRKSAMIAAVCMTLPSFLQIHAFGPVDRNALCSLTIANCEVEGAEFRAYKVAEITEDAHFEMIDPFKDAQIAIDAEEYREASYTLASFVVAEEVKPASSSAVIEGEAVFEELENGLYLVVSDPVTKDDYSYVYAPVLVCVPTRDTADQWVYDVVVEAKYERHEVEHCEVEYSVVKHWIDSDKSKRPVEIEAVIMKNNETVETVTLSSANNWSYRWKAEDDGSVWSVMEKKVPKDYKVKVTGSRTEFVINNTYTGGNPPGSPPTGDTQNLLLPILLMIGAGGLILFSGVMLSRKK